jgi:hypothetical protein
MEDKVKLLLLAAAFTAFAGQPQAEAAGWRSCKTTAAKCTHARTHVAKPAKTHHARRVYRDNHYAVRGVSTREYFFRQMLDN